MKKFTLLASTALVAGYMSVATPAIAAEDQGWFSSMKQSVQTWFSADAQENTQVEAYLDEVTIAVPPMTGEEAAAIQPAAGDYVDEINEEINTQTPAATEDQVAPGSLLQDGQSSFNNNVTQGNRGSVAAFEDNMNADDFANIMPAAGDAEEITDESNVIANEATPTTNEVTSESTNEATTESETFANDAQTQAEEEMENAEQYFDELADELPATEPAAGPSSIDTDNQNAQ